MARVLPLDQMSQADKLEMMEALWDDLSRDSDAFGSPDWHKGVLQERENRVIEGKTHFIDWEAAKSEIRRHIT